MNKIALLSVVTASVLVAGGYKIPETSTNGVALSAANIAHSKSADAAYYNPANMAFMEDKNHLEIDVTYIGLDPVNFKGTVFGTGPHDLDAQSESFIVPSIHYVSGKAGETRLGLSITTPGGLSKRWSTEPAKTSAEEFTLKVIEINPSVAIPVNDKVAVAFGFRIVHSEGIVKSDGTAALAPGVYRKVTRDMTGESLDFGYNLALSYKPNAAWDVGITYRSQVNLGEQGEAKLTEALMGGTYDGDASVTIPLPATASAALAYTLASKTTVELVYERNMWSAYKNLDFNYDGTITNPILIGVFDRSIIKNWNDTNTFRLGITQELDALMLMAGAVYDESPVPEETVGFELPDSDSVSVSFGGRYQINKELDVALAALYSMRQERQVENASLNGEFTNANVLMVSAGIGYKF